VQNSINNAVDVMEFATNHEHWQMRWNLKFSVYIQQYKIIHSCTKPRATLGTLYKTTYYELVN